MSINVKNYLLWTAIVTPFKNDLSIDFEAFEKLLKLQEAAHNGVVVLGSTGENLSFNEDEKRQIVDFACSLKLNIPLMVGVPGFHLPGAMSWVAYLETKNIHAYLMVTPIYTKPNEMGQYYWFKGLMDNVTKPCMLYNIPGRSGTKLNMNAAKKLLKHSNFWAVKESSGQVTEFESFVTNLPGIDIYCGDDMLMPYYAYAGAKGLVSVASNIWPKETHAYTRLSVEKKTEGLFPLWQNATNALFSCSNPVPVKVIMHEVGMIKTPFTRPPLSHEDLKNLEELKTHHQEITNWGKRHV